MTLEKSEVHEHKFTKDATKTSVTYRGEKGGISAKDILKLKMCIVPLNGKPCGKLRAYDLERTKT